MFLFKRKIVFSVVIVGVILLLLCVAVSAWRMGGSDGVSVGGVSDCLIFSGEKESACFASLCEHESGYLCAEKIIDEVTALQGPEAGVRVLRSISENPLFVIRGDLHQLAHIVGRSAARNYGGTGDVFNRCPLDFDYGCLHGFFEHALSQVVSPGLALTSICDSFKEGSYDKSSCYHGGGHGLMMNESYDLDRALSVCDSLPSYQSDCETGVFMENAIGFVAGRVPPERALFLPGENWLAPCDSIERKYRRYCYAYHFRNYLPYMYSARSDDLIAVCLGAGKDKETCLGGLAETFVTVHNEIIFSTSFPNVALYGRAARAAYLCDHFPDRHVPLCHRSVLRRLLRIGGLRSRLHTAREYCGSVEVHKEVCDEVFEEEEGISVEG